MNTRSWPAAGLNPSFHASGSNQKQCLYMTSVELPVSMYTWWIMVSRMEPWIMKGLSPFHLSRLGLVMEKVSPCMVSVMLHMLVANSALPHLWQIMRISCRWSAPLALSLGFSALNLARRLLAISIMFLFSCFSSISYFKTESLTVSCVLLLWYSQYCVLVPFVVGFSAMV